MANFEEVDIASQQKDVEPKVVDADGHKTRKDSVDDRIYINSPTCERFSIRGYVASIRTVDRNTSWLFPPHLLQTRLKEADNLALPPLEIPDYRWWNCERCLGDMITSAESPTEREYMRDSNAFMQAYDGNSDCQCPMFLPTSNVDIQEKQKENMLDGTETVESVTVDLKPGNAVGSAYETDKEKKDEVVTDCIREHVRTESIVLMEPENDKPEITDLKEKKSGIPFCLSNCRNSEETINIINSDKNVESEEMGKTVMETMALMLVTKTKDELGLKRNKSEEPQIPCQVPNSWEYFSRKKNVFKEISEKMKGKEVEQAPSPILGSENSTDANKLTNISNVPVHISYDENAEPGQLVIVEGKYEKTISKGVESLPVQTMEFSIPNENDSHKSSEARNDVPYLDGNYSSCSEHMNINKITEVKECTELSPSQDVPVHISYDENAEPGQLVVVEGKDEKTISKGVESLPVQTMEFSIPNEDDSHKSSDARNDVPYLDGNYSSCSEHMNINKITEVKECNELSTSQVLQEKDNVLLSEQTGKAKASDSRSKRKPQKKRLISDIIASKLSHPESWNKETEQSKSADEMAENMCMTDNNEQSPCPKEDHVKVALDAIKGSSKLTIDIEGVSEVNVAAERNNVMNEKERPEKLKVRKKQPNIGVESLDAFAKNFSTSSSSQAVTNALQRPQGISLFVSASRDKSPKSNFLNPEYGKIGQRVSEMEDEVPMDIVELMAKNQHERGLSNLNHECHNLQKDRRRLKMKETDLSQVNKHVEGGTARKKNTAKPKSKAQPKQTGKSNLQASLRNHYQSDLIVDSDKIDVFQGVRYNSFISDKEGTTSGSCKGDLAMLQSSECFNPRGKYSPDFVASVLDETISACNLKFPIDGTKSHVSIAHCDRYGDFSSNKMVADSTQLQTVSTYCGHMQMQSLCRASTPALSDFTGSGLPLFQNKSDSSLSCNGYSHQKLTRTDSPQDMNSESSDLGNSGKKFDILSESHKGNGTPNLAVGTDGSSGPLYFNGQSNSVLLQRVKVQARQSSGKKHSFPSAPVLRLMEQSVSVPAKCRNEESIATDNGDSINFSNPPQASSQKHVNCFHSSRVMERSQGETFSGNKRVFKGSEPIQDSLCKNEKIMKSIKAIPPVPKFRPSGHYVSNGHSGIFTPSTVPGNADVALESSVLRIKSPSQDTLLSGKKLKKGLQCTNGYIGNLKKISTAPPSCQITKAVKGLRSYRRTPTAMRLNRTHRSAPNIYLENGHHCFPFPWVSGSNPGQNLTKEAEKAKSLELHKENEESTFCGKNASNVEICTLNQNPAEIIIDGEEDGYSFGYDHFTLSRRNLAHTERKREMAIPQAQKRRRTLKKHMEEFLCQKDGYVGDPAQTNVDNLDSLGQELISVKELVGNIT